MLDPYVQFTLLQASVVVILSIGFTWTYMVEKFPNFAQTSYATLGTMLAFHLVRVEGWSPYQAWLPVTLACGVVGVLSYLLVVRTIRRHGAREITLTFVFYSISLMIGSVTAIYSYTVMFTTGVPAQGFVISYYDIRLFDLAGAVTVAPATAVALIAAVWLFLHRAKLGIAIRAIAEDEDLAQSLGVDTTRMHLVTWFIAGALAGIAGCIIPMWRGTALGVSDEFLVIVMASSVIGGLDSIAGAIVGGVMVTLTQRSLNLWLTRVFGIQMQWYESLLPIIFITVMLIMQPNGFVPWVTGPHNPRESFKEAANSLRLWVRDTIDELKSLTRKQ